MATNKTRIKIRHGSTTPVTGTDGLLPYELGWDGANLALYINNNGNIRKVGGEGLFLPLTGGTMTGTLKLVSSSGVYNEGNPMFYWLSGYTSSYQKQAAIFTTTSTVNSKKVCERFYFREYSHNSSTGTAIEQWDQYRLPVVTADKTSADTYEILTSKSAVTIAQGGTSATTAGAAANNLLLGLPTWTANPNDDTYFIRRDIGGADAFGQVKASTIYNYIKGKTDNLYVKKAGDTLTGSLITTLASGGSAEFKATRGNIGVWMGIGSANTNHGLYSITKNDWIVYANSSGDVTLNGNATTSSGLLYSAQKTTAADLDAFHTANQLSACIWSNWSDTDRASASYPGVTNGIILDGGYTSTNYGFQIAIDDDPTGFIALRQKNGNGWQAWNKILTLSDGNSAYVKKAGDSMTGNLIVAKTGDTYVEAKNTDTGCRVEIDVGSTGQHGLWSSGYYANSTYTASGKWIIYRSSDGEAHTGLKLYGAVWNDYAEYRNTLEDSKPGQCVIENGDDSLRLSTSRMQRAAHIVSDTFGFAIGKTDKCKTPVAVSGRVLAYIYEGRQAARGAIGRPVCSGPNGTVSIMTDEEYKNFGYCAIGTISAVPEYEKWGEKDEEVDVNGRIWIKVY